MKFVLIFLFAVILVSCASKPVTQTTTARIDLEKKWKPRIGSATKADIVEELGNPEWCMQDDSGSSETCRFSRKTGVKYVGEADDNDKKRVDQFDQIIGTFDRQGVLRDIEVKTQR